MTKSSSPPRFARHGYSLDSGMPSICTPSLKEESDLSSGPPSSVSGYEPSANYGCMSNNSSPRKPYFNSIYDREEHDLLDCSYDTSLQSHSFSSTIGEYRNDCQQPQHPSSIHPLMHPSHSHAALFYAQNQANHNSYSDYPFYNTGYYPSALSLSPCHENTSSPSSNAAAIAVAAASSTAAAAAAAAAVFMRPSTASPVDLLSHHQDHYNLISSSSDTTTSSLQSPNCSTPPSSHFLSYSATMPETSFQADI